MIIYDLHGTLKELERIRKQDKDFLMKRFKVNRINDVSGITDTGRICEGCLFSDGKVAIRWLGKFSSSVWWDSLDDCIFIMSHDGNTQFEWID